MYDTSKVTDEITLDKILAKTNEYYIYSFYLGENIKVNKPISSPFREDKNPSWGLFRSREGNLMWKDFATGETGNVIHFVQNVFNITYPKALEKIWEDFISEKIKHSLNGKLKESEIIKTSETRIGIKRKRFSITDKKYWEQYNISKDTLDYYNVYPISTFWINEFSQPLFYSKDQPMYAYKIFDKFKIYRPYAKNREEKWRTNCSSYDIQGFEQLPSKSKLLIITKSLKDVMVLHEFGYDSIAPQSEVSTIPKKIMENLTERFEEIVIFFDYDEGGIKGANKLAEKYNIKTIFLPKHYIDIYNIKDISDFVKEFGYNEAIKLLKNLFKECVTK